MQATAHSVKQMPEGFTAFKNDIHPCWACRRPVLPTRSTQRCARSGPRLQECAREALGDDIEIAVHGHNELDEPSAAAVAKVVEPMNPLFMEDALNPPWSEAWQWRCGVSRRFLF